ncbi:unnamed protein product [Paramecium pentaurelia]|uniref:Uncharacterized protein n=1 Tax=Paramecium pentaurelia TaxID=43138 RepID=A0A8S1V748_9CILI|nr:unnamed protein product [Paramecium pentaurelia]
MKIQLIKISEGFSQYDYQQIKDNLQMIQEWYKYSNNQEEIMMQNEIGTQLQLFINIFNCSTQNKKNDSNFGFRKQLIIKQEYLTRLLNNT